MNILRKAAVEIYEAKLDVDTKEPIFVRERPIESITRRLKELGLTPATMAEHLIGETEAHIIQVLEEEEDATRQLLAEMLNFVGLELVTVRTTHQWQDELGGHWYHGEGCVYCGSNVYDTMLYGPENCPNSKLA